jgi:photosystem II stability/assembly factor-like uncharacterized protein
VRKSPVGMKARRSAVAAAASTVIASALALAACGTVSPTGSPAGASGPAPSATGAAQSTSPPSVVLPGFQVLSMTFVSDSDGFALGTVGCGTGRCDALLTSTDGGASWSQLPAPTTAAPTVQAQAGPAVSCPAGQPCVAQVRFATQQIGYAYDPSLVVTTDGGAHWQLQPAPAVSSLETADGTVARVATPAEPGTGCSGAPAQVSTAPAGGSAWQVLPAPAVAQICPPVLYRQGQRLVLVGYGNPAGGVRATAQIARSGDGGKTWAKGPDSCGGTDGYASGVALAPPDVLVLLCQHQMPLSAGGYAPAWVRVSVDGGASFAPDEQVPSLLAAPSATIMRYQLAAASSGRLLVTESDSSGSRALLTENGGQDWSSSLSMPAGTMILVGYQDPLTARIAEGNQVWTTHDGGSTWTADQF